MPSNVNPLVQRLFDLGHFNNPAMLTGVVEADLPKLQLHDAVVKIALRSFQEFMAADFDRLALEEHGRIGIADGEVGPATERLFHVERCGCPDYSVEAANGSGSWPAGCHPEWPANHAFKIRVNKSGMPSFLSPQFEAVFDRVQQAYANVGIVFFRGDDSDNYNTYTTFQNLGGSTIGLAIVPNSPRCGEKIWSRFAPSYQPSDVFNQWCRLLAHEWGHNMGMSHSRGGIMNPSIVNGPFTPTAWRGDPSEPILVRWFGGTPVNIGGPGPDDPPPTNPGGIDLTQVYFSGTFTLSDKAGNSLREFILTPKPKV